MYWPWNGLRVASKASCVSPGGRWRTTALVLTMNLTLGAGTCSESTVAVVLAQKPCRWNVQRRGSEGRGSRPCIPDQWCGVAYAFALARASTSVRLGSTAETLAVPRRPLVPREAPLLPLLPLGRDGLPLLPVASAFFSGLLAGQRGPSEEVNAGGRYGLPRAANGQCSWAPVLCLLDRSASLSAGRLLLVLPPPVFRSTASALAAAGAPRPGVLLRARPREPPPPAAGPLGGAAAAAGVAIRVRQRVRTWSAHKTDAGDRGSSRRYSRGCWLRSLADVLPNALCPPLRCPVRRLRTRRPRASRTALFLVFLAGLVVVAFVLSTKPPAV